MKNLTTRLIDQTDRLVHPHEFYDIERQSPATAVLTDFRQHWAAVIEQHMPAVEAAELMRSQGVEVKLVVNHDQELVGSISVQQLDEPYLMRLVAEGARRREITVAQLMTPRQELQVVFYDELERSTVDDLLHALERGGQSHYVVVDRHAHHIRGLVSAHDIGTRLHCSVKVNRQPNFSEIVKAFKPDDQPRGRITIKTSRF